MKRFWIPRWLTPSVTRTFRKPPRRARPILEILEDRCVPSIVVNNPTDTPMTGETDLRQAIAQANTDGGPETITFDTKVFSAPQTIDLSGSQLELSDNTGLETIMGPSVGVTVNAGGMSRVFQVDDLVSASISGMTITGGNAGSGNGGGILNYGSLALTNCTVSGNTANGTYPGGFGGGVFSSSAALSLTNCTVSGNSASYTGGICLDGGTAALVNCTVSGNTGNGIGGLQAKNGATATLLNCTISGNAGTSPFGSSYGGLYAEYFSTSTITLGNTIVAGNTPVDVGDGFGPAFISEGNNLIGGTNGTIGWVSSDLTGTTILINPVLAPLGNYGGPTQTMALLPGSPALAAGNTALLPAGLTTDQRGLPRVVNGSVDIGAFESQGFTFTPLAGSTPQTAKIGTAFAKPLGVTVTANNPIEPVNGGIVSFAAHPAANGASALLSASSAVVSGGQASVTAAPDDIDGTYQVIASAHVSVPFSLTNTGPIYSSLVVNTTSDALAPGAGLLSLREAIGFANLDRSGNTKITFDPKVFAKAQTIALINGQLELSNATETETITGPSAGVTVNAGGGSGVFQVDQPVTVSFSGLTITDGVGGVQNAGSLTLTDCTLSGNTGDGVNSSGTLKMSHCIVSDNTFGPGVVSSGTLGMTDCTVTDNSTSSTSPFSFTLGGGVLISGGEATLADCTIDGNSAGVGAGLGEIGGTVTLTNCTLSDNSASAGGGGVSAFSFSQCTITLTGCKLTDNSAKGTLFEDGGGAVQCLGGVTATLSNCTLSDNSSSSSGGGLLNQGGTATLTNCTVTGNSAAAGGGGIGNGDGNSIFYPFIKSTLMLTSCVVSNNSAADGGAVGSANGTATLTNCTISGNSGGGAGGGVYLRDNATTLTNCTISGNTALTPGGSGGGLQTDGGTTTVTGCIIRGNSVAYNGGALANYGGNTTLANCIVSGNSSSASGGGVADGVGTSNSTMTLNTCAINGNSATTAGGGVSTQPSCTTTLTNCIVSSNTAGAGGGIANQGTTTMNSCIVADNRASTSGGGISTTGGSVTISASIIDANRVSSSATALGGGIACENSQLSLTGCTVSGNLASGATALGGGIYALDSTVNLKLCIVSGNQAIGTKLGKGGGIYSKGSTLTQTLSIVLGNIATTAYDDVFSGP